MRCVLFLKGATANRPHLHAWSWSLQILSGWEWPAPPPRVIALENGVDNVFEHTSMSAFHSRLDWLLSWLQAAFPEVGGHVLPPKPMSRCMATAPPAALQRPWPPGHLAPPRRSCSARRHWTCAARRSGPRLAAWGRERGRQQVRERTWGCNLAHPAPPWRVGHPPALQLLPQHLQPCALSISCVPQGVGDAGGVADAVLDVLLDVAVVAVRRHIEARHADPAIHCTAAQVRRRPRRHAHTHTVLIVPGCQHAGI